MTRRVRHIMVAIALVAAALLALGLLFPSGPTYKSATITRQFPPESKSVVTVDDAAELQRLIGYMPGLGTRSGGPLYSLWTTVAIDLTTADGRIVSIRTDFETDMWSEHGRFYHAKPGLGKYLRSLLDSRGAATTQGTP